MPSLYSSYQKCGNNETKITISLIREWLADDKISEDEYASIKNERDWDCLDSLKDYALYVVTDVSLRQEEIELPENFPRFKTKPQGGNSFTRGHID